ncbi:MAG: glycosyltransferase family 4 protein [Candidatus Riflebacteria bacterium]|nr:glycosyltransferase family 4 protein [Candidatus Riflebacteria bacterium]
MESSRRFQVKELEQASLDQEAPVERPTTPGPGRPRLCVLSPWAPPEESCLEDYLRLVLVGLSRWAEVDLVLTAVGGNAPTFEQARVIGLVSQRSGPRAVRAVLDHLARLAPQLVLIQYFPFQWSSRGLDITVPLLTAALRLRGLAFDVVFHELWVPLELVPHRLLRGLMQRAVATWILALARRVVVSSFERVHEISRCLPWCGSKVRMLPIPSLVPDGELDPNERERLRAELGVGRDEVLLGVLGFDHDSKPVQGLWRVRELLEESGIRSRLLVIGKTRLEASPAMPPEARRWPIHAGYCPGARVSALLGTLDVFLAPMIDGISSRRSSTAAALAHGVPVVTTSGHHTDPALFDQSSMRLAPAGDEEAFAMAVLEVAASSPLRLTLGRAGQELYRRHLGWPRQWEAMAEVHRP